jgi:hypothetical protein
MQVSSIVVVLINSYTCIVGVVDVVGAVVVFVAAVVVGAIVVVVVDVVVGRVLTMIHGVVAVAVAVVVGCG